MNIYSEITPEILSLTKLAESTSKIDPSLYAKYDVKRGLRDINGKGVLAGLTDIGNIHAYDIVDGVQIPCEGKLYYRGYDIEELVSGFLKDKRFGFEEVTYLLLFGQLPDEKELRKFSDTLAAYRSLPTSFVRDIILKAPSHDMMNTLARSVLTLYTYDERADDVSLSNVIRQCLQLIALFPMLSVYGYQAYSHYHDGKSLFIHNPDPKLSTAENLLHILRPDSQYTELEARILDIALVLHMEHGGGNNSTFTTHVVSSSGTDTYSSMAASLGSLKGPKHGGANIKVVKMFEDMKTVVKDWSNEEEVRSYLRALLNRDAFDHAGLIYGMGHAVYSLSDPRANIFKSFVEKLSREKGREEEFQLYSLVERLAPEVIGEERKIYKGVSANVDFYSGFVYSMLDLPTQLFTPIFAIARVVGWSAHRIEELANNGKIIRPAYKSISEHKKYVPMKKR
ncbi:MAG: citrate/2-methylcitrate synthase [Firmicutes bacterium]|nr:citrate/2-methylcitrate synthase [Lachnospiraceae bacterium]MDD6066189.1 citrate/2-methylcitrate synthase [Bacillota bacterium]MDY2819066.1 citrate/2-methylcitrate synthase [Hominisplanchenecus sp.]